MKFNKKEKKQYAIEEKYNRMKVSFIASTVAAVISMAVLAVVVYTNFDYLAFKTMMTKGYIYQDSLMGLIDDELEQVDSNIEESFDAAVINVFLNKLYDVSGDRYTYLYLPYQYSNRILTEKSEGKETVWYPYNSETAYLGITNFTEESYSFVKDNSDMINEYPKLIIDLRGNPGGYVTAVNKIADMFLDEGDVISSEITKEEIFSSTNKSENPAIFSFDKIVILQDKNTASAAEILIGALSENLENVTLLGETTYGKGIGQTTIPLKNGFYLKATAFSWATPNGNKIQGEGILADNIFTIEKLNEALEIK